MIGHYLRMVWNRRRANGLILAEILISFLVLCLVFSIAAYYGTNWRKPLGFDYRNRWVLEVEIPSAYGVTQDDARALGLAASERVLALMNAHPGVVSAAPMANTPYSDSRNSTGLRMADGRLVNFLWTATTPRGLETLGIEVTQGRWIEPGDEALPYRATVISENLARRLFGRESPLGRSIESYDEKGQKEERKGTEDMRIVGVFRDYKKAGELADTPLSSFHPQSFSDPKRSWEPWSYVIRVAPGTPAAFEEALLRELHSEQPTWTFTMRSIEVERQRHFRDHLLPLLFGSVLAGFLLLMVGMGLMGVLWQNVTRRTQELGLRRALGATTDAVRGQILGEIVVLTAIALVVGTALFLQLPLLGVLSFVGPGVFASAAVAAAVVIVPFVILCGLYPGWLATRVEPARALQYE